MLGVHASCRTFLTTWYSRREAAGGRSIVIVSPCQISPTCYSSRWLFLPLTKGCAPLSLPALPSDPSKAMRARALLTRHVRYSTEPEASFDQCMDRLLTALKEDRTLW